MEHNSSKKCKGYCPFCGEQECNIKWSEIFNGDPSYRSGVCNRCGERFDEIYHYHITTYYSEEHSPEEQLVLAAREILSDFDSFGEVLQADENSKYTPGTAIECLRLAVKKCEEGQE